MNFYRRRPLALIITLSVLISALCAMQSGVVKIAVVTVAGLAALATGTIFKRLGVKRICNINAAAFIGILSALTASMLLVSFAYYNVHVAKYETLTYSHVNATVIMVSLHHYQWRRS